MSPCCAKSISILIFLFESTQSQSTVLSPDGASCPDVEVTFSTVALKVSLQGEVSRIISQSSGSL